MVQRYPEGVFLMNRPYHAIDVEKVGDVDFVRFRNSSLDDYWAQLLGEELRHLIDADGCRKLVVSFAHTECLYSVLLGKLMSARRLMQEHGGRLKLLDVSPLVREVFATCKLDQYFEFAPDRDSALNDW